MSKQLTEKALAKFEAQRDVWQEILESVREIKAGGGKRTRVQLESRDTFEFKAKP
jgi:putative transcriptional regulator